MRVEVGVKKSSKKKLMRSTWGGHVEKLGDQKLAESRCPGSGGEMEVRNVMVCQCKCIERHMQSKRSVLEDDETRGRSVLSLSLLVIVIK